MQTLLHRRKGTPLYHQSASSTPVAPDLLAAIDLGSNSFHMIVARMQDGQPVVIDKLREMVRLAAGLTPTRTLSMEAQHRALECLERFGQRLRSMPPGSVRAVGTNTFRIARNARSFLRLAEAALGHPIEIISGIEEARLIYLGVANSLPSTEQRRLVMDIGGGSTEFIIGVDKAPILKESLRMGCVSMSMDCFTDGKISAKRFKKAALNAGVELEAIARAFGAGEWEEAVGASGTLRTIHRIVLAQGLSRDGITAESLERLVEASCQAGHIDRLPFPVLSAERRPIFPGGLAILHAAFRELGITRMRVADGALREGLLDDLLGRLQDTDVRTRSVTALAQRYHVDGQHAARVGATALQLLQQLSPDSFAEVRRMESMLLWASELHEIGLDIAHSQYHKHGAYIAQYADLPGFSQQDQQLLALLIRAHRRKFPERQLKELELPPESQLRWVMVILRLAVLLHRSRLPVAMPEGGLGFAIQGDTVVLHCGASWLEDHPLTAADLEQEVVTLAQAGITLRLD